MYLSVGRKHFDLRKQHQWHVGFRKVQNVFSKPQSRTLWLTCVRGESLARQIQMSCGKPWKLNLDVKALLSRRFLSKKWHDQVCLEPLLPQLVQTPRDYCFTQFVSWLQQSPYQYVTFLENVVSMLHYNSNLKFPIP